MTEAIFLFMGFAPMTLDEGIWVLMGISISAIDAQSKPVLSWHPGPYVHGGNFGIEVSNSLKQLPLRLSRKSQRRWSFTDFVPSRAFQLSKP